MSRAHAPVIIRSASDLAALRPGRPPVAIALHLPGKPPLETALREDRLVRAFGDCGCSASGAFMLTGLAASPFLFLTGVMDGLTASSVALRLLLFLGGFALAGSVFGRWRARRGRRRELTDLARWIESG